jgi:pyridoxal phosphate enzyme (YggS family)
VSEPAAAALAPRLARLRARIATAAARAGRDPAALRLVAVTKSASPVQLAAAYAAGLREFGENRVQDALPKLDALPADVVWHLIGHLQSNKVNKVLGRFELIHAVDSWELADRLAAKARERELVCQVLVQVNCSGEASKSGLAPAVAEDFVLSLQALDGLLVRGLMTMAPLDGGETGARASFRLLASLRAQLTARDLPRLPLTELSMGMSDDFEIAIAEGATLLRIGRALFGPMDA